MDQHSDFGHTLGTKTTVFSILKKLKNIIIILGHLENFPKNTVGITAKYFEHFKNLLIKMQKIIGGKGC